MNIHYTEEYLLNPTHPISIDVIGCGGTGSQVITGLARMNEALTGLGHSGITVKAYDDDIITQANIGRQLFSESEIGNYKSSALITRVNRFFGFNWEARIQKYNTVSLRSRKHSNIIITCADNIKARIDIQNYFRKIKTWNKSQFRGDKIAYYWLDYGNSLDSGQVVLSTLQNIPQPKSQYQTHSKLKSIIDLFPKYKKIKDNNIPSCSLAEALNKQDLFINSTVAQYGLTLIWKLFREAYITIHGAFINLKTFQTNPIWIK